MPLLARAWELGAGGFWSTGEELVAEGGYVGLGGLSELICALTRFLHHLTVRPGSKTHLGMGDSFRLRSTPCCCCSCCCCRSLSSSCLGVPPSRPGPASRY